MPWGLCPYDLRLTPEAVLAHVTRTHPYLTTSTASLSHTPLPAPTTTMGVFWSAGQRLAGGCPAFAPASPFYPDPAPWVAAADRRLDDKRASAEV